MDNNKGSKSLKDIIKETENKSRNASPSIDNIKLKSRQTNYSKIDFDTRIEFSERILYHSDISNTTKLNNSNNDNDPE